MSETQQHKVILVGDAYVGKSNLLSRIRNLPFVEHATPSENKIALSRVRFLTDRGYATFTEWDFPGEEKLALDLAGCFYGADVAIIVYDLSNPLSYGRVEVWVALVRRHVPGIGIIVCGNKADLVLVNKADLVPGEDFNRRKEGKLKIAAYFDVSAKSSYNFDKPWLKCAQMVGNPNITEILKVSTMHMVQ